MDAPTPVEEEQAQKEDEQKNMTEDEKAYAENLHYIEN